MNAPAFSRLLLASLLALPVSGWGDYATFHVSPQGNDGHPGSLARPLKTIQKAFDKAVASSPAMTGDIVIKLRGGYHALERPITLGPAHGGRNGFSIRLEPFGPEKAVIGGGRPVTGWRGDGKGLFRAYLGKGLRIRQLYADGRRLQRARSDDIGASENFRLADSGNHLEFTPKGELAGLAGWKNRAHIEVVGKNEWRCFRGGLASVEKNAVRLKEPFWSHARSNLLGSHKFDRPSWIENALELLDRPGEWYYDPTSGYIHLKSDSARVLSYSRIHYGAAERLLVGRGRAEEPLRDVRISGIAFAHTGWAGPSSDSGFVNVQVTHLGAGGLGMMHMPAALAFENVRNISVHDNLFIHLGGDAVNFGKGTAACSLARNTILDASGSGIILGEVGAEPERAFPADSLKVSGNLIRENYVARIGQEFLGSVGIFLGLVEKTRVVGNELHDLPSTGISLGWGWGDSNYSHANLIRRNKIGLFGRALNDNGGIYVLGRQPGSVLDSNFIHGQQSRFGGIYLDNGTRGVLVERNVVHNSGVGERWIFLQFHAPMAVGNTVRDNFFQLPNWRQCSNESPDPAKLVSACEANSIEKDGGSDISNNRAAGEGIISAAGVRDRGVKERRL